MWINGIRTFLIIIENIIRRIIDKWESEWNREFMEKLETI